MEILLMWTASEMLDAWDRGYAQKSVARGAVLLGSWPGAPGEIGSLTAGEMNRQLLRFYRWAFGAVELQAVAECPQCHSQLETSMAISDVASWLVSEGAPETREAYRLDADGFEIVLRQVTIDDLAVAARCRDVAQARRILLDRCVVAARREGQSISARELTQAASRSVSDFLGELDPAGDPRVGLKCVDCGHEFGLGLDLAEHFWLNLEAAADRLCNEVAALSKGFGWSESDVLAMSPHRRRFYLNLLDEVEPMAH
jgi:hypothetical protein